MRNQETDSNENTDEGVEMGFMDHLEDLRSMLIKSVLALVLGMVVVGVFIFTLADALKWPLNRAYQMLGYDLPVVEEHTDVSYSEPMKIFVFENNGSMEVDGDESKTVIWANGKRGTLFEYDGNDPEELKKILAVSGKKMIISNGGDHFSAKRFDGGLRTNTPMEIISVILQCVIFGGLAVASPMIVYFIAQFILPALTLKEKKLLLPGIFASVVLFLTGAAFTFFFLMPVSLFIMIQLNEQFQFEVLWNADSYYGMLVWFTIGIGVTCEFPLILLLLVYLGVLSVDFLSKNRRLVFVVILVLSAILTPTGDPLSLFLVAGPLYFLYELAILAGKYVEKRARERMGDEGPMEDVYHYETHDD